MVVVGGIEEGYREISEVQRWEVGQGEMDVGIHLIKASISSEQIGLGKPLHRWSESSGEH